MTKHNPVTISFGSHTLRELYEAYKKLHMSKHTPGPWKWESDSNGYTYLMSEAKEPNSVAKEGFIYPIVVRVGYDAPSYNRIDVYAEIREEDARLIAAAPTLLAALREAENALADYVPKLEKQGAMMGYGRSVLKIVRETIAKAGSTTIPAFVPGTTPR